MNPPDPTLMLALVVALVLMLPLMAAWRRRGPRSTPRRAPDSAMSDRFEPQAVRVMTTAERQAHALLQKALPNAMVLAQVPFTRFLKVNGSQQIWLQQAAGLSADLLLCDACTRVLAVVDVRSARISEGSRKRHERKARLLKAAGIRLLCWQEDALPDVAMIRSQLAASHPTSTASATADLLHHEHVAHGVEARAVDPGGRSPGDGRRRLRRGSDGAGAQRAVRRTGARSAAAVASLRPWSISRAARAQTRAHPRSADPRASRPRR